jgi:hypothetical protein
MALISPQTVGITGTAPTYGAVTATDTIAPNDRAVLHVKNASGGSINVTVVVPGTQYGQPRADVVVAIPNGQDRFIGPFPNDLADPADGLIDVNFSGTTSVTAALIGF